MCSLQNLALKVDEETCGRVSLVLDLEGIVRGNLLSTPFCLRECLTRAYFFLPRCRATLHGLLAPYSVREDDVRARPESRPKELKVGREV